jgi:hypothetical protein
VRDNDSSRQCSVAEVELQNEESDGSGRCACRHEPGAASKVLTRHERSKHVGFDPSLHQTLACLADRLPMGNRNCVGRRLSIGGIRFPEGRVDVSRDLERLARVRGELWRYEYEFRTQEIGSGRHLRRDYCAPRDCPPSSSKDGPEPAGRASGGG